MIDKERLIERRKAADMKPVEVAEAAGISRQRYNALERTGGGVNSMTAAKIATALKTSAAYLEGYTDDPAPLQVDRFRASIPNPQESDEVLAAIEERMKVLVEMDKLKQAKIDYLLGKNKST